MSRETEPVDPPATRSGRALVVAGVVAGGLFVAYLALGMPGMDHGPTDAEGSMASMESMDHEAMEYAALSVDEFAAQMSEGAFVVNVHRPYAGEIDGTDAFIEFDDIAGDRRLPAEPDTPILLYCKTGRMSAVAAEALVTSGYTDVAHLEGGMEAWESAGRPLRRQQS